MVGLVKLIWFDCLAVLGNSVLGGQYINLLRGPKGNKEGKHLYGSLENSFSVVK